MRRQPLQGSSHHLQPAMTTSFAWSRDPCTSNVTSLQGASLRRWRVRGGIAVGQTCESRKNRHRGLLLRTMRGSPFVTAPRKSGCVTESEKDGGLGHPPCEDRGLRFGCSHVVCSCRSRQATSGLEYARHTRSKKSGQGRVNRGLARSGLRRDERRRAHRAKGRFAGRTVTGHHGAGPAKAQGGA
jgi:hypothetical protein